MAPLGDPILIDVLHDHGDARGSSYTTSLSDTVLPFSVGDLHVMTLRSGSTRGNHYHLVRDEVLIVVHNGPWTLFWDSGERTETISRAFDGRGVVQVTTRPQSAHALRNDGPGDLLVVGLSNQPFDPECPDAYPRVLV